MTEMPLTFEKLRDAVVGDAAAIRLIMRLEPAGGPQDKVFPPTYAGAVYASERRRVNGAEVDAVVLDSVQSQANRLELALLEAYDLKELKFPLISVSFDPSLVPGGRITALEAPHRIADAIFRDSVTAEGLPFRPQLKAGGAKDKVKTSKEGERFASASVRNATPLFELCPTALIFGVWDSTGAQGGLGNKFARTIVSEIVAINAVAGVRTSSRIDPLGIEKCDLYEDENGDWTNNPALAKRQKDEKGAVLKDKDGNEMLVLFKRKKADKGKPSEINHGNVTPDLARYGDNASTPDLMKREEITFNYAVGMRDGDVSGRNFMKSESPTVRKGEIAPGGVTMSHAVQTTVLSLAGLRRLRFPIEGKEFDPQKDLPRNNAARSVLAALALAAVVYQKEQQGYDLRSRCVLIPADKAAFEIIRTSTDTMKFSLTTHQAKNIFDEAVKAAVAAGFEWQTNPLELTPKPALVELVKRSRELVEVEEET